MTEYDNTNSGAIFVNQRKETDKHPDRTGSCEIKCPECGAVSDFWMSGWIKTARSSGQKFMSMAFTAKEADKSSSQTSGSQDDFDDDIPF